MSSIVSRGWSAILMFLALLLTGCANPEPAQSPTSTESEPAVAPKSCDVTARRLVETLVEALSEGDSETAAGVFAESADFQWFSATTADTHFVAYNHEDLRRHLEQTYTGATSVELTLFNWNGVSENDVGNFDYRLEVGDAGSTEQWVGKGALLCSGQAVIVWSMAAESASSGQADEAPRATG